MSWASGPTKKKANKKYIWEEKYESRHQANISAGVQPSVGGTDDEDGEWATAGVPGS